SLMDKLLDGFNKRFERTTTRYALLMKRIVNRRGITFLLFAVFAVAIWITSGTLPSGFIPNEDQGMIYAIVQMPPGSTLERTNEATAHLQKIAEHIDDVASVTALAGYEVLTEGRGSNAGTCLIELKGWSERKHTALEIVEELEHHTQEITGATIEFFGPPAVPGYGAAGGFSMRLLDKTNSDNYKE